MVIQPDRWLRIYSTTAHEAAAEIHKKHKMLTGDMMEHSNPAGTASMRAARRAGLHDTSLASRTASLHCSGWACPATPSDVYSSCGRPQAGQ
jgi:hypothetical protein